MSSVAVGDIIKPLMNWNDETLFWVSRGDCVHYNYTDMTKVSGKQSIFNLTFEGLTVVFGLLCIGFAFLASVLESLIHAALSFLGLFGGALLGPAVLGMFFPFANEKV